MVDVALEPDQPDPSTDQLNDVAPVADALYTAVVAPVQGINPERVTVGTAGAAFTVTVVTTEYPLTVYEITAVPGLTPFTTPADVTVAIVGEPEDQLP